MRTTRLFLSAVITLVLFIGLWPPAQNPTASAREDPVTEYGFSPCQQFDRLEAGLGEPEWQHWFNMLNGKGYARVRAQCLYGWGDHQFEDCLVPLWDAESDWKPTVKDGIPQAKPGWKMASHGEDWRTNPRTQISWGLAYIIQRPDYDNPCDAWEKWQERSPHWY